jgi:methionyl-tRNA formyltransferase
MAAWLAASTQLVGVMVLREPRSTLLKRAKNELKRSGVLGFTDVFAFRLYQRWRLAGPDTVALAALRDRTVAKYGVADTAPMERVFASPNAPEAQEFLRSTNCDVAIARCKFILKPEVFEIPSVGTFVLHPGVCPEYRNAHGCFWALARRDLEKVATTLLKVDRGVDTGPVFGYYSYGYDEAAESHTLIQQRVVYENLDAIAAKLKQIAAGGATPIDTAGRPSAVWGQPQLTKYLGWKRAARRRGK